MPAGPADATAGRNDYPWPGRPPPPAPARGGRKAKSIEQAILFLGINQVAAMMTGLLARQAIPANSAALASFCDLARLVLRTNVKAAADGAQA